MKKEYINPTIEIVKLENVDIVTESVTGIFSSGSSYGYDTDSELLG